MAFWQTGTFLKQIMAFDNHQHVHEGLWCRTRQSSLPQVSKTIPFNAPYTCSFMSSIGHLCETDAFMNAFWATLYTQFLWKMFWECILCMRITKYPCRMPPFAIDASLRSKQDDVSPARRPQSFEFITILSLQPVGSRRREERPAPLALFRLLHSSSLVAVGLSVGCETWPPIYWHHPFVIGCSKYRLGLP